MKPNRFPIGLARSLRSRSVFDDAIDGHRAHQDPCERTLVALFDVAVFASSSSDPTDRERVDTWSRWPRRVPSDERIDERRSKNRR